MEYSMTDISKKPKAFAIKTIMNNKALRKEISEGLNSKIGSTKRIKAAKLLRSLNKAGNNFFSDGKGGGGSSFNPFSYQNVKSNILQPGNNSPQMSSMENPTEAVEPMQEIDYTKKTEMIPSVDKFIGALQPNNMSSIDNPTLPGGVKSTPDIKQTKSTSPLELPNVEQTETTEVITPDVVQTDTIESSTQDTENDIFKGGTLSDMRRAGIGATGLRIAAMADKSLLDDLDLPEEVVASFPTESLAENKESIKNTLLKKYGIMSLEDNLINKYKKGASIVSDLTYYLAETDDYFKSVDKLYNKALEQAAYMDTSNPEVAKRVNNYTNYLGILRDKQNDRNSSFITMAANQSKNEIEALEFEYNTKFKQFLREYGTEEELATEEYNDALKVIEELEENLDAQIELEDRMRLLESSGVDINKNTIDNITTMGLAEISLRRLKENGESRASAEVKVKEAFPKLETNKITSIMNLVYPETNSSEISLKSIERGEELVNSEKVQKMDNAEATLYLEKKNIEENLGIKNLISKIIADRKFAEFIDEEWIKNKFSEKEIKAAAKALDYKKSWYRADTETFMKQLMRNIQLHRDSGYSDFDIEEKIIKAGTLDKFK